jgi:diguanylate cyclase (GGDEF)-like protein
LPAISDSEASSSPDSTSADVTREDSPPLDPVDLRIGVRAAITAFFIAAALIPVIALPIWKTITPIVIVAGSVVALACGMTFVVLVRAGRVSQASLYVGDFLWIGLTAGLVAGSAGRSSPFFLLYPMPVLHAGAFQRQSRLAIVSIAATGAFLAPLAYDTGHTGMFIARAIMAVPPTLVVAWGFNVTLTTLRRQRREVSAAALHAEQQAQTDPLTGLGNYRLLWSTLERETSRARRHNQQFSLIVIDLDGFKTINDQVGHLAGDAVLRAVGVALRSELREEDVCCRHGGDEFAVIAIDAGDQQANELVRRLVDAITGLHAGSDLKHTIGATAGWATFSATDSGPEELMRRADAMLLKRKYGRPD